MKTVFLLIMIMGAGEDRREVDTKMYFYDLNECSWYARELAKRYGNYQTIERMDHRDRVTTYCVPREIDPDELRVY